MIKYIGSKRLLIPKITEIVNNLPEVHTILDLFSGTSRVGHALKKNGYSVTSNDHNAYAFTLARCYIQADRYRVIKDVETILNDLRLVKPSPGYFTETFCIQSRFFHPKNGEKIDAIREAVAKCDFDPDVEAVLLVSLMEAADRVDSTTGLQMAYLKNYAQRAFNDLELRLPEILPGPGRAVHMDAKEAATQIPCDLAYLDPPYNQHSYRGNYHIWESLVRWDKPEVYGVACKRLDCKDYSSPYNSKRRIYGAMEDVVIRINAKYLLVSFNNEGYLTKQEILDILGRKGKVYMTEVDYKRYVGAQIGIFNPKGDRVGEVSHITNKEGLYLVVTEPGLQVDRIPLSPKRQLSLLEEIDG